MSLSYLKGFIAASVVWGAGCATTQTSGNSNTNYTDATVKQSQCQYGKDLVSLENIKDAISKFDDQSMAVLKNIDDINQLITKTENISSSSRPEDALGCRFLEMEARVLLIEMPPQEGQSDPYTSAQEAIEDVKTLCTTTSDRRMCSVAGLHDATLFSRRSAAELKRIADSGSNVPINWEATRSVTQSFANHVNTKWPVLLRSSQEQENVTNAAIERSLFASACTADDAMTKINRRVSLNFNRDQNGNLVPYGKDSGELLAYIAVAMDLSPDDSCYRNPVEGNCRGRLANIVHLACLRAGENAG